MPACCEWNKAQAATSGSRLRSSELIYCRRFPRSYCTSFGALMRGEEPSQNLGITHRPSKNVPGPKGGVPRGTAVGWYAQENASPSNHLSAIMTAQEVLWPNSVTQVA